MSVITHPSRYFPYDDPSMYNTINNLVTRNISAYKDEVGVSQVLTIGSTGNMEVESAMNVNVYMGTSNAYSLYTTSYSNNVRSNVEILSINRANNTTIVETPSSLTFTSDNNLSSIFTLGSLRVSEGANAQIIDTGKDYFGFAKSMEVQGDVAIANNMICSGNIYGKNMNLWKDTSNTAYNRIGYALCINSNDQLEIIKYAKFNSQDVVKKIAVFGTGTPSQNDISDTSYLVFNSLGNVSVASSNGSLNPLASATASSGNNMTLSGSTLLTGHIIPSPSYTQSIGSNTNFLQSIFTSNIIFPSDTVVINGQPLITNSWASSSTSNVPSSQALSNAMIEVLARSPWTSNNSNIYFSTTSASNMNVGIGYSNPAYKLSVNGVIHASGDVLAFSDARVKTNLAKIPNALDKVMCLNGYTYERSDQDTGKRHAGVIAQEIRDVLPEVVMSNSDGFLSVAYGNITALLIEAIKELNTKIDLRCT
jgi:hypothetical protein